MSETFKVSSQVKVKTLATLAHWMHRNGLHPMNKGQIISMALDQIVSEIVEEVGTTFHSDLQALEYLESYGFQGSAKVNQKKIFKIRSLAGQSQANKESRQLSGLVSSAPPERFFDQKAAAREVVENMLQMGQKPTPEALELAGLELSPSGKLVPTRPKQETFPSGKTDGLAGPVPSSSPE